MFLLFLSVLALQLLDFGLHGEELEGCGSSSLALRENRSFEHGFLPLEHVDLVLSGWIQLSLLMSAANLSIPYSLLFPLLCSRDIL